MVLPLITIGMSVVVAQRLVAIAGLAGLGIANQSIIFMSGMMVGAGTDYAVFLISRYHDYLRQGADSDQAVKKALTSIGKVIAASAATVAITFLGMVFTQLGILKTVGPMLGISVAVVFFAAVTLLPALMVLTGRRGWIAPRRDLTRRFWRSSGVHRASAQDSSARQRAGAGYSGRLRRTGPVQLRRSQDASGFRREFDRVCRVGQAFPV